MEERFHTLCRKGPTRAVLLALDREANCSEGWNVMQTLRWQLFFGRALAGIRRLDVYRQNLVLTLCGRFLDPADMPEWPARALLMAPGTCRGAAKLVKHMRMVDQAVFLPVLAGMHETEAIDIVHDLSYQPAHLHAVANAVVNCAYHPPVGMLAHACLWRIVWYLRENNAIYALTKLARHTTWRAIRMGVFTHLIGANVVLPVRHTNLVPLVIPDTHTAILAMYLTGHAHRMVDAMREEPLAVDALVEKWPALALEAKWIRRRAFVISTRACGGKTVPFWRGVAGLGDDVMSVLVGYM